MTTERTFDGNPAPPARWKRYLTGWGILLTILLIAVLFTWNMFFVWVPPGKHLVITANDGEELPTHDATFRPILAEPGQKGVLRETRGEGWHFVLPIVYARKVEDNTVIPAGQIGVVTAQGGYQVPEGYLATKWDQRGIQQQILPPGTYRINQFGYKVDLKPATEVKPGFVGVKRRLLVAREGQERGLVKDEIFQPGLYYINPLEFEIIHAEVGIFQTTFNTSAAGRKSQLATERPPITFTSKGGFPIVVDCTIEWELLPKDMPTLVERYGAEARKNVERNVVDVQVHRIGAEKGSEYSVEDLLDGAKREKFQEDFTQDLMEICKLEGVHVRTAFIRQIELPPTILQAKQDRQIAYETELTRKVQEETVKVANQVKQEEKTVDLEVRKVEAETAKMVAEIDQEAKNVEQKNLAELEQVRAEVQAKIAELTAQQKKVLGEAEAKSTELTETAKAAKFQLQMDVFQNDSNAFLRYTLAKELRPDLVLRLFHSGPGTFWTNMDGKGLNFMMPMGQQGAKPAEKDKGAQAVPLPPAQGK